VVAETVEALVAAGWAGAQAETGWVEGLAEEDWAETEAVGWAGA